MSSGIVSVCRWSGLFLLMLGMTGCSNEKNSIQDGAASRAGYGAPLPEMTVAGERDAVSIRADTAHGRLWVLRFDSVRVYDTAKRQMIAAIALPNWFVFGNVCMPDMVLDRSGSAFISSNVIARLWRIDADSFEVSEHEINLQGKEHWDVGWSAMVLTSSGTLYALTSTADSLWHIDVATASARMIEAYHPPLEACALSKKSRDRLEMPEAIDASS